MLILLALLLLAGCAARPDVVQNGIEVAQARVVLPPGGADDPASAAAGFMLIKNSAGSPDRLAAVSADFGTAALHETRLEGSIMSMEAVSSIDFPAGALVELRPGSYHVMITALKKGLKPGDTVHLTLEFEKAGRVSVPARVTEP